MRNTIRMAATVATIGLVGCGNMDDVESEDVEEVTSALTFAGCIDKIEQKAVANAGTVGTRVGSYQDLGTGSKADYTLNASIFCKYSSGATQIVMGLIRAKYLAKGAQNFIGYPTTDELPTQFNDGRFNLFDTGLVLWKSGANQAFEVHGSNLSKFGALGNEWGMLGYATAEAIESSAGKNAVAPFSTSAGSNYVGNL